MKFFWANKDDQDDDDDLLVNQSGSAAHLSQVVEVVLAINPAKWRTLVDAVGFVDDVTDVSSLAVIQHALE